MEASRNWFNRGGGAFAAFRPHYPSELAAVLRELCSATELAVDVGCGTGQLTRLLAEEFTTVIGIDPSRDQLAHASGQPGIAYLAGSAEALPIGDDAVDLICAAQAAHWFDLPAFYREARRVAGSGAVLALLSYGILQVDATLQERFSRLYQDEIGPFWPPERALVEDGYRSIPFPFTELSAPELSISAELTLAELLGYLSTWSAVRAAAEAGRASLLTEVADDLTRLWGDPDRTRTSRWPLTIRAGRI